MLKREKDPKILKKFLNSIRIDVEKMAFKPIVSLFPVEISEAEVLTSSIDLENLNWQRIDKNFLINPDGKRYWIRKKIKLPKIKENNIYGIKFKFGEITESLMFLNRKIYTGIATGGWDDKKIVSLPKNLKEGEEIEILIHTYSGNNWGSRLLFGPQIFEDFTLYEIRIDARNLYYAFSTALDLLNVLEENLENYHKILKVLEEAYMMLDFTSDENYLKSCSEALKHIEKNIYNGRNLKDIKFFIFGHAHIDVAWLWTLESTIEKTVRTFTTQISQMEKYPLWIYQQGQVQLYKFIEDLFPEIFENIKKKVKEGRWEASGGCWVEFDTNIPSGESIIRQILYGKEYFKENFGIDCKVLWLPDVFGYSGALPQILKKSGIELFITTKISWNQYTRFPYDTFYWKGIDGSKILTHFITTPTKQRNFHTYNTTATPTEVYETYLDYQQKNINNVLLMPYGFGDGGGGPKEDMLNRIEWMKKGIEGFFKIEDGGIEKFCKELIENLKEKEVPVYEGELYLEFHRGTYTTQAKIKKANRKNEFLLRDTEIISIITREEKNVFENLKKNWQLLLLNQFHDILPGSSIAEVYKEALIHHTEIGKELKSIMEKLFERISQKDSFLSIFNPFSWNYTGYVKIPFEGNVPEDLLYDFDGENIIFKIENIPPFAFKSIRVKKEGNLKNSIEEIKGAEIENSFYKIKIDRKTGRIISLFHKDMKREFCEKEGINIFEIFEDKPVNKGQEAWDIDYIHQYKCYEKDGKVEDIKIEKGNLFQRVKIKKKILNSLIFQEITVYKDDPVIYFDTEVEWKEDEKVLKVAFPVKIHTDYATYDIQFGSIKRPTHRNTIYEHAKFEVPAQKWIDLSEGFAGISILTDCKYGYSVKGNIARITLLRSPTSPDPTADRGTHTFSYGLLPHYGGWEIAETPKIAYQFNDGVKVFYGEVDEIYQNPLIEINQDDKNKGENLIVETIKVSEDKKGIILRIYECKNSRGTANVKLNFPNRKIEKISLCDCMEEEIKTITENYDEEKGIKIEYLPFEIINFKIYFKEK